MATRKDIAEALQAAEELGDQAAIDRLLDLYDQTPSSPMEKLTDPNSFLGPILQAVDDPTRVAMDAFTRGYGDKIFGEQAQEDTRAARERLSGTAELGADIAGGVAGSPYRIGSTLAGGALGGLEGAAEAYGHQKGWVPEPWNILKRAGWGIATGSGAAKLGEKLGGAWSRYRSKKDQPFKTDVELETAAGKSAAEDPLSMRTVDLKSRAERVRAIRDAQGGDREAFSRMLAGMTSDEAARASKIAAGKSLTTRAGDLVNTVGKQVSIPLLVGEAVASGGIPWTTLTGMGAKAALSKAGKSKWATRPPAGQVEDIAALTRDPRGIGTGSDPATIDTWRDALAKMGISYGRSP